MNQIRYFSLLGLFILLCYAAPASLWVDSLKGQTLFEKLSGLSKRNRLPHVDLNTRIAYHTALSSQSTEKSAFRVDYLRLEVSGDVTDRIYYKWLQHLNRSNTPGQLDNMPSSIDCLGVGFRITPTVSTFIGKQYADFGGIEYYPMKENLHFFAAYRGKRYTYTALGKNFQALDEHPQTFSLGLIYKIPIL